MRSIRSRIRQRMLMGSLGMFDLFFFFQSCKFGGVYSDFNDEHENFNEKNKKG